MSEATEAVDAAQKEAGEKLVKITKRGFDPRARLENRGLRKGSITLYLDEEDLGPRLGKAVPITNRLGTQIGMDREGVLGEIDALQEQRAKLVESAKEDEKVDTSDIDAQIAAKEKERDDLIAQLTATGLHVKLTAVPPVIEKNTRRLAREKLGITQKGIPDNLEEEFNIASTAFLMAEMFVSVTDNATGEVNTETTYDDAIAYIDLLPPGQFSRLDLKMGELQFTDAISRTIESQEDFS